MRPRETFTDATSLCLFLWTILIINPLNPGNAQFSIEVWDLFSTTKNWNRNSKHTYSIIFGCALSIGAVRIAFSWLQKPIWRILNKNAQNLMCFVFLWIFFSSINLRDRNQTATKSAHNMWTSTRIFFCFATNQPNLFKTSTWRKNIRYLINYEHYWWNSYL